MKPTQIIVIFIISLLLISTLQSQVSINETSSTAHASAILDVSSSDKGVLIPRMTASEKESIANPATGLMIYQSDKDIGFHHYNGSSWQAVAGLPSTAIVFSESEENAALIDAGFTLYGKQSISMDSVYTVDSGLWSDISTLDDPEFRTRFAPAWTGQELIIWGGTTSSGLNPTNEGSLYNPSTDQWTDMTLTDAPAGRIRNTGVWTGDSYLIWGGQGDSGPTLNTGGYYDPINDTWTSISTTGAPSSAYYHSEVWTGQKLIVWGGIKIEGSQVNILNSGGVYDLATDTWSSISTSGAPSARYAHTAIWTGEDMIIWGGLNPDGAPFNDGYRYNPATDTWSTIYTDSDVISRGYHGAILHDDKMIIVGGTEDESGTYFSGIQSYDINTDTWTTIASNGFNIGPITSLLMVDDIIYMSCEVQSSKYYYDLENNVGGTLSGYFNLSTFQKMETDNKSLYVYGNGKSAKYSLSPFDYLPVTKELYMYIKN